MQAQMKLDAEPEQLDADAVEFEAARLAHSLLSVLMPATPPQPKNARIIRLFDYEAAQSDPQPGNAAKAVEPKKQEPTPREAAKAARKLSLFAAAGLV